MGLAIDFWLCCMPSSMERHLLQALGDVYSAGRRIVSGRLSSTGAGLF